MILEVGLDRLFKKGNLTRGISVSPIQFAILAMLFFVPRLLDLARFWHLLFSSDGIHANMDPLRLGVQPGEIDTKFLHNTWEELASENDGERLRSLYAYFHHNFPFFTAKYSSI